MKCDYLITLAQGAILAALLIPFHAEAQQGLTIPLPQAVPVLVPVTDFEVVSVTFPTVLDPTNTTTRVVVRASVSTNMTFATARGSGTRIVEHHEILDLTVDREQVASAWKVPLSVYTNLPPNRMQAMTIATLKSNAVLAVSRPLKVD